MTNFTEHQYICLDTHMSLLPEHYHVNQGQMIQLKAKLFLAQLYFCKQSTLLIYLDDLKKKKKTKTKQNSSKSNGSTKSTGWKLIIQDTHINSNLGDDARHFREQGNRRRHENPCRIKTQKKKKVQYLD